MIRAFKPRCDLLETRDNPASTFGAFGAAAGGLPLVQVTRSDGTTLAQFSAFEDAFRGGVVAATGELDGDPNTVEVVTGAGPGGGPAVRVYSVNVTTGQVTPRTAIFAFEPTFTGGVRVAVGDVTGQPGRQQVIVAADQGGGPRVRVFDFTGSGLTPATGPLSDFLAYEGTFRGGVRVAAGEIDGNLADGDELVVAAGPGGGPRVRVFRSDGAVLADYFSFRNDFGGGAQVSVESTGVTGRVQADAFNLDPSQRNGTLNQAAFVAANPTASTGTTTTANPVTASALAPGVGVVPGGAAGTIPLTTGTIGTPFTGSEINTGLMNTGTFGTGFDVGSAIGTTGFGTGFNTVSPFGGTTSGTGFTTQGTGFGTISQLGTTALGTGFNTVSPFGGTTGFNTAGLGTTGFTTTGFNTAGLTGPISLGFGPFGNPGLATAFPTLNVVPFGTGFVTF